jgi:hypothetical protein
MEPVIAPTNAQLTLTATEHSDNSARTIETAEEAIEPFLATIVRLDQSAAEQLFRAARL